MDEKEGKAVRAVTVKLTPETYELYKKVYEEVDPATANQFVETLLERFYNPVKADKGKDDMIAQLQNRTSEMQGRIGKFESDFADYSTRNSERDGEVLSLNETIRELRDRINEMTKASAMPPHSHVIEFDPLNEKVAKYVAARETVNRKGQDWSIGDLINFYIEQWFIKGNPNGSLDNVPDKVIDRLKKELETE
jgi:uncharacterized coiled-coil DUF342 family protein